MVPTRALGKTGITVSTLGLGTVKLGRTRGVKYPTLYELPTDEQAAALLAAAVDLGITLLDTAPAYGVAEERLGGLLRGSRDRWILCTKAGEEFDESSGQSRFDFSPAAIVSSVERSLRRLRTDHLDIVLLHSNGDDETILNNSGTIQALHGLKARGLLRAAGISVKSARGVESALTSCDVVMVEYSPAHPMLGPYIERAAAAGVGVLAKKVLGSGHAATHSTPDSLSPIEYVLRHPGVASAVVGTLSTNHLRENARQAERVSF